MKKLGFFIAALLVLAIFGCSDFTAPNAGKANTVTLEDGRVLAELTIGFAGAGGRALTEVMAIVATERYEVAFTDGTNVYRTAWRDGEVGRLWVNTLGPGDTDGRDYGGYGNAILFAGSNNGTLLAVGELVLVDGLPSTYIRGGSRNVTFALTPLENDVYGYDPYPIVKGTTGFGINGDEATFVIDYAGQGIAPIDPDGGTPGSGRPLTVAYPGPLQPSNWFDPGQPGDPLGTDLPWAAGTTQYDDAYALEDPLWLPTYPRYDAALGAAQRAYETQVIQYTLYDNYFVTVGTGDTATDYGVFWLPNNTADIVATWSIIGLPPAGIVTAGPAQVIPRIIEIVGFNRALDVTGVFTDADLLLIGTTIDGQGDDPTDFEIELSTRTNQGLIKVSFDIPVNAISNESQRISLNTDLVAPGTWFIRGGISNTVLDVGAEEDADGGALLLGVGIYIEDSTIGWIEVDGRYKLVVTP